ncbi:glycosyltransferase [bacterium]|nr:glycosyltransferase [bacterium]
MKFLFLTSHPLIPNNAGNTVRTYTIMKWLKENGHTVDWITFATEKEHEIILNSQKDLNNICDKYTPIIIDRKKALKNCIKAIFTGKPFKAEFYNYKEANDIIKKELREGNYDIVSGYLYLTSQFVDFCTKETKWLDIVDSISLLYERQIPNTKNLLKKLFLIEEKRRVLKVEGHSVRNFDLITMISDTDKNQISKVADTDKIVLIKNGVNLDERFSSEYNKNMIAYLGDMAYIQNHNAVMWFIDNVLPDLVKVNPDIILKVIGKGPKEELIEKCRGNKHVLITGLVDDVKKELMECAVLICPIKISSGLQNKVLEAMSVGVPSIVTEQIAIPITKDKSILLQANSEKEWIEQIQRVCENPEYRLELSGKSKEFIENNFSWKFFLQKLGGELKRIRS